jgi:hypothetical protein
LRPAIARARVPRYIRRIIHDQSRCHYQREEYRTAAERNARYTLLKSNHVAGLVRYSDAGAIGIVYVVAWIRPDGAGMAAANSEATGGRVPFSLGSNFPKNEPDSVSMEIINPKLGKSEFPGLETVSMEIQS